MMLAKETIDRVKTMIERALRRDPSLSSVELQRKAAKIDKDLESLSGRQFHAQFALPVRRRLFGGARSTDSRARGRGAKKGSEVVASMLRANYVEQKALLDEAIDEAFRRAIDGDSVRRIDQLITAIERKAKEFRGM